MRVIGVTGGVGAGKSTVLGIMEEDFQAYVIQADQLGHILMEPGEECYDAVIALFGKEIIKKDKTIDRRRISDVVFTDKDMLLKLNGIIHPAVKQRILDLLGEQKEAGREICVVEAALFLVMEFIGIFGYEVKDLFSCLHLCLVFKHNFFLS